MKRTFLLASLGRLRTTMKHGRWCKKRKQYGLNAHVSWQQRQLYDQLVQIYGKDRVYLEHWVGRYRLDIHLPFEGLCFELDDASHADRELEDKRRDNCLALSGIKTIRLKPMRG
jgi:very-short-patch-repair endonuclease